MRKHLPVYVMFISLFAGLIDGYSQAQSFILKLDKENYRAGDTISFATYFSEKDERVEKGTLFLKIVNQNGQSLDMRWPILDGISQGNLVIPDSFPPSKLKFFFGASRQFFAIYGFLKQPSKLQKLGIVLIADGNKMLVEELPLTKSGYFEYTDKIFEDEATIFFSSSPGKTEFLDIEIASMVDSTTSFLAHGEKEITVGEYVEDDSLLTKLTYKNIDSFLRARTQMLAPVFVTSRKRPLAEQFSDKYSTGVFRDLSSRTFDLLENPEGLQLTSLGEYVGLYVLPKTTNLRSRVQFYLDEMRVDYETIAFFPTSEVAIIKAFQAPFFSNPDGTGAAIAIYTKRGEFYNSPYKRTFRVKGYTPQIAKLKLGF